MGYVGKISCRQLRGILGNQMEAVISLLVIISLFVRISSDY